MTNSKQIQRNKAFNDGLLEAVEFLRTHDLLNTKIKVSIPQDGSKGSLYVNSEIPVLRSVDDLPLEPIDGVEAYMINGEIYDWEDDYWINSTAYLQYQRDIHDQFNQE